MTVTSSEIDVWLAATEGEHFEFKEAKNRFGFDELTEYCMAIANEGGGKVILGITNRRPRQVVGTQAFLQIEDARRLLSERLHLRIEVDETTHSSGFRVLVFHVPSRPLGTPVGWNGKFLMRDTDSLVPMSADRLRQVFEEAGTDFSAQPCRGTTLADLDDRAIEEFRRRWISKSGNVALMTLPSDQLLAVAEAIVDGVPTFAAIVLFGSSATLGRHLAQAELVFEYRSSDASGPAQDRKEFRQGFFLYYEDLWRHINLRNNRQHFQDGLFVLDIPTFAERPVREVILNAVSHRNYQLGGNIFVRQFPHRLEIVSPGGFPPGIDVSNVLDRQNPRNRRIADIFTKCGLVERSGQGMNLMFEDCIKESKPVPNFAGTDSYQVAVTLDGQIDDPQFLVFLSRVGRERLSFFSSRDFLALDAIRHDQPLSDDLRACLPKLIDDGIVERIGRGRGTRYILSRQYYQHAGKKGVYTRRKGLDRGTNKQLLLKHIEDNQLDGSPLQDLLQVLPSLSRNQVQTLLKELKAAGKVHSVGRTRGGKWFSGPGQSV